MNRDAAIEAGARATYARVQAKYGLPGWDDAPEKFRTMAREDSSSVIDAALPHLARPERVVKAEALREAATQAHVLDRAPDPTSAAFHWLQRRAHLIERGEP